MLEIALFLLYGALISVVIAVCSFLIFTHEATRHFTVRYYVTDAMTNIFGILSAVLAGLFVVVVASYSVALLLG